MSVASARIRVIDLETGGNGADDVCEIGWQDVCQDVGGVWRVDDERGALLVNPGRLMSPDTLAVHHILDSQVKAAPFWRAVAPPVLRPEGTIVALAAHRAAFEQRYCRPGLTGGADWICTWKCALRLWPALPRFSNQILRYLRTLEGLVHELGCRHIAQDPTLTFPRTICVTCLMRLARSSSSPGAGSRDCCHACRWGRCGVVDGWSLTMTLCKPSRASGM